MSTLAIYNKELDAFEFDTEKLSKAGLELNVLYCKNRTDPASERTLDLLILKALKNHFEEEKVISFNAMDCYINTLKTISKKVELAEKEGYVLDHPINPDSFSQEQVLQFYENKNFNLLIGMTVFLAREYKKIKKNKS